MAKRWNLERAREFFAARGCELLEAQYQNSATPMHYIATCGHEHVISLDNFRAGKGDLCRDCRYRENGRKKSISAETIRETFEAAGCRVLSTDVIGSNRKITYIAQCGHVNHMTYEHFRFGGGRVCSKCSRSIRYGLDYVREAFEEAGCELLEDAYINCKTPMRYIATCGHESVITFDTFLNAPHASLRCKKCHKHTYHEVPMDRNRTASKVWRKAVYARDGYTCRACGKHGGDLNAHHLDAYDTNPTERFHVANGVTLCPACHTAFHRQYGFGGNTKAQFEEWLKGIPR